MTQNIPAKHSNSIRVVVGSIIEVPVSFPGAVTVVAVKVQNYYDQDIRMTFNEGGTYSTDNFWTIKSGEIWRQDDISWTPDDPAFWLRSPAPPQGDFIVEILYWS